MKHLRSASLAVAALLLAIPLAWAATTPAKSKNKALPPPPLKPAEPGAQTENVPNRFAGAAGRYYKVVWGIDALQVKLAESGQVVRFSWRVLDADLATALNDKRAQPALQDPSAGVSLVVPTMEQIGQLRQTAPPEAGKSYWMAFSNKGRFVKPGHRVNVVIGTFHADGLVVE
ncbi:MAG TPA: hypothetical protein VGI93_14650 [Steroidobacteraceae bacterium]|jgi:hypothetical protein